jgi:hypothetical protein
MATTLDPVTPRGSMNGEVIYNGVGSVKTHDDCREPGGGSRPPQAFIADP